MVLLETRHVKAALSAMAIKTDRRDARGIAQLLRMGWYRPVHRKSVPSQEVRALWSEFNKMHREVLAIVKEDQVCRRLMTVPGVGAVVSLTYRAGVDDPARFAKLKSVGAFFGLTPKRYQSGETDVTGAITRAGEAGVRTALHDAANAPLSRATKFSTLKRWAMDVAKRRGMRRAKVALSRCHLDGE